MVQVTERVVAGATAVPGPATPAESGATAKSLVAAVRADRPHVRATSYEAHWWNGQRLGPCLLVRDRGRRRRVVPVDAGVALLAGSGWRARRQLARLRTGRPAASAAKRLLPGVGAEATGAPPDYRICPHIGCGGVVALPVIGADPPCPRCGRL